MCLEHVDYNTDHTARIGYKVFNEDSAGNLHAVFNDYTFDYDRWLTDPNPFQIDRFYDGQHIDEYGPGFHIFFSFNGAWGFRSDRFRHKQVIIEVKLRKTRASGYQNGHKVLVSGMIYIDSSSKRMYTLEDI